MQAAVRPCLTASVAVAAAGTLALSPMALPQPATHTASLPQLNSSVRLTAYDPIAPWIDAINTAAAGATTIANAAGSTPFPLLQQIVANQLTYLGEVLQNPGNFSKVLTQISANIQAANEISTLINADYATIVTATGQTLDLWHSLARYAASVVFQANPVAGTLLNVLSSPASGVLIGLAGPMLSPAVALSNSVQTIVTALSQPTPDLTTAAQTVLNIPASMFNAALNGATVNLGAVTSAVNNSGLLPAGITLKSLTISLGGLFTPGNTGLANGIGGSIFNSVGVDVGLPGWDAVLAGHAVGPIAALTVMGQLVAKAIGWSGTGNPLSSVTSLASTSTANTAAAATSIPQAAAHQVATQQVAQKLNAVTTAPTPKSTAATAAQPTSTAATATGKDSGTSSQPANKKSDAKVSRAGRGSSAKSDSAAKSNSTGSHSDNKGGSGK
jgi:hypothetical protein